MTELETRVLDGDIDEAGVATLRPLESMSPSRFLAAKQCPLREAFSANRIEVPLPYGPAARLGSAIHSLLEAAGRGEFDPEDAETIDRTWNHLVQSAERLMGTRWMERHMVPLKDSVSDFEVRRLQAHERALELAATSLRAGEIPPQADERYGCELSVASPDRIVRGQIDAVVRSEQGPVVLDYKSGAIFEPQARGAAILKPTYQIQLRLYAALYFLTFGEWPARLEIVPVLGDAQEVSFDRETCASLVEEAREALEAINRTLSIASSAEDAQVALARPSPDVCRHCAYRPICAPYKRDCEARALQATAQDVLGTFTRLQELGNGRLLMEISAAGRVIRVRGLTPGMRHPALVRLAAGDRVGIFNMRGTGSDSTFTESSYTVVYRFTAPPDAPETLPCS